LTAALARCLCPVRMTSYDKLKLPECIVSEGGKCVVCNLRYG